MSDNMYSAPPRLAYEHMRRAIRAGLVPMLTSSPGMGKSSLFRKLAREFNLWLIDHRVSTSQPEDLTGLPEFRTIDVGTPYERRVATFTPFDLFPIDKTPLPKDKDGWLVLFDEFNSGELQVQAACYKIFLDRMVGQYPVHERVAMGAAGNLMTDKAITNDLSTAMQSRLIHIELELSHREWLEDVAIAEDYDERIIAYLNFDTDALMDFRPDHQDKTFCCPRTWEFMNKLIKGEEVKSRDTSLYAGTITAAHAAAFVQFCEVYKELITVQDVLRDPAGAPIPMRDEMSRKWAIIGHLQKRITKENFTDLTKYINRWDEVFQVLFYRGVLARSPELRTHPAYADAMLRLARAFREEA